jgi:diguanylate cyclase (GGDEF)-like protein
LLERIRGLASTDGLTGIANRRSFDLTLERELQRSASSGLPMSLLLVDIDHFKRHNDDFGHQVGDHTLRAVAQALASNARQSDLAARYGGEEFAVILPGAGTDMAIEKAERLRQIVAALPEPAVTVSIGVATYPFHGRSADDLIAAADAALYTSKRTGRDQVCAAEVTGTAPLLREVS